jgi:hypothetical protein
MADRSPHTDALGTLGTILTRDEKRDAIHLAVMPVEAGERLGPGTHITVKDGLAHATVTGRGVGIVDPFLEREVRSGERFWLVLYPRTIESLRHVWSHPALPDEPGVTRSPGEPVYIAAVAEQYGLSTRALMEAAKRFLETGEDLSFGVDLDNDTDFDRFWLEYEAVTGERVPEARRESFFTCAC